MDEGLDWEIQGDFPPALTQNSLICAILMCIVAIVGLVGNSLMIRAWVKYPRLRNDFYTVFAALSIADMIFLVISVPANIIDIMDSTSLNTKGWCRTSRYLVAACGFVAAYLLVALATLRAILLTNRNTIPRPRAKHLVIISLASYVVVFLISIPIFNMHTSHQGYCYFEEGLDIHKQVWLLNSFATFVPLFLVFLLYFIAYLLGKRFFADSYSPREKQKSRLVNSVVIAFVVCQLPFRVFNIYESYLPWGSMEQEEAQRLFTTKDYLMCLLLVDKVIRPILYSKLTSDLSHTFDEIVNCQNCHKNYRQHEDNSTLIDPTTAAVDSVPTISTGVFIASSSDQDIDPPSPLPTTRTPSDSDSGFGRSISTSSSASTNSQTPLVRNHSMPSELEML